MFFLSRLLLPLTLLLCFFHRNHINSNKKRPCGIAVSSTRMGLSGAWGMCPRQSLVRKRWPLRWGGTHGQEWRCSLTMYVCSCVCMCRPSVARLRLAVASVCLGRFFLFSRLESQEKGDLLTSVEQARVQSKPQIVKNFTLYFARGKNRKRNNNCGDVGRADSRLSYLPSENALHIRGGGVFLLVCRRCSVV